jgi:hypothetical protein
LATIAAGEIYLQVIAEISGAMEFAVAAESFEFSGEPAAKPIHCQFVVTGRFDLDHLSDGLYHRALPFAKPRQADGCLNDPIFHSRLNYGAGLRLPLSLRRHEC